MVFNAKTQRGTAATKETAEARYLRKKFDFSTDPDHVTINLTSVSFLGGEANSDNQVQGFDYAWLRALWGTSSDNLTYDINGGNVLDLADFPDLNGDGIIDALDYDILKDGWYNFGEPQ